jgi:hypothetical protein
MDYRLQRSGLICVLALAFCACLLSERLYAQVLYGSVVGTVTDPSGALIPGTHVTISSPLTGIKREADTGSGGSYTVPNLPEGTYDMEVTASGFRPFRTTGLLVKVGAVVRQDVQLQVGSTTQEITVQAGAALLQTEKSEVSTSLSTVPVENLPTGFYRNYQALLLLVPGAADNLGMTGALADTPERALAIPINGMDPASNSTRIDGAQSIFLWKPGGAALYVPPVESIQEVKIATNSYDPEKGMAGSAAMDVITKSGTNELHGTAFWYHFNQHLTSCDAFDQNCKWRVFDPTHPRSKPKEILNDLCCNLGGPIKKDKLFYFANWDGVFQRDTPDGYYSVPTGDERGGDFSRFLRSQVHQCLQFNSSGTCTSVGPLIMVPTTNGNGVIGPMVPLQQGMIFDPTTGNLDGTNRAVFAFGGSLNVMPPTLIGPTAQTILGFWPTPNVGQGQWITDSQNNITHNFFLNAPERFNRNNLDFKVDWNQTERHFIWVKYSVMKTLTANNCGFNATIGGPCPATQAGSTHVLVQTATLGHTWNLSPTFVADGSLGFSRMSQKGLPQDFGKNIGLDVLKIPGTNDPNDIRYSGAPTISVGGFDPLGSPFGWMPLYRNDWTVTIAQNAGWTRGNHSLRFGVDVIHNHLNHWQPENGLGPRGGINFNDGHYTFLSLKNGLGQPIQTDVPVQAQNANQFASFLLGTYDEAGRAVQFQKANGKDWWYGFHFLDRWKITPRLTANLGLRYEYYPVPTRDSLGKGIEQYDAATNMVLLGGLGGNPRNLGVKTQKGLFGPRIGLAYELDTNTVLRAGFGSTFDTYPILRELRGPYPAVISSDFTYNSSVAAFDTPASCALGANNLCDFQGLGTFAGGIPAVPLPDVSKGVIPIPTSVDMRFLGRGLLKRGRVETWNITAERRLPGDFLLGVGYVGNHMTHGWGILDLNASDIDQPAPLSNLWGRTAGTFQLQGFLDSHYNALQVTLDRHYSKGLYIKGAYTYSKAINLAYDTDAWGGAYWQAPVFAGPGYRDRNRGMADIDRRHIFRMGYVWELPLGAGHKLAGSNRIGRAILGGWQLNGVWSTNTGAPTTLFGVPSFKGGEGNHQTLDQVAPIKNEGCLGPGTGCYWYSPLSFAPVPLVTDPDGVQRQHRFGTTGRNIAIYSPGHSNLDQSLFRHFNLSKLGLSEKYDLQFRAEALNVFNHPTWDWQTNEWGTSNYCWGGGPSSNPCGNPFMQATDAFGHRIIRLGLRLAF